VDSLQAGAGHPPIRGVQDLAAHGEVDRSTLKKLQIFSSIAVRNEKPPE
jgi:hypothetical protein